MTLDELSSIEINQYDSGFSMWINQPGLKQKRCILDASMFKKTGNIHICPPTGKGFIFGTFFKNDTIKFVVIE